MMGELSFREPELWPLFESAVPCQFCCSAGFLACNKSNQGIVVCRLTIVQKFDPATPVKSTSVVVDPERSLVLPFQIFTHLAEQGSIIAVKPRQKMCYRERLGTYTLTI